MKFVAATYPDRLVLLYIYKGTSSLILSPCIVFHTVVINKKNTKSLLPENRLFDIGICLKITIGPLFGYTFEQKKVSCAF